MMIQVRCPKCDKPWDLPKDLKHPLTTLMCNECIQAVKVHES